MSAGRGRPIPVVKLGIDAAEGGGAQHLVAWVGGTRVASVRMANELDPEAFAEVLRDYVTRRASTVVLRGAPSAPVRALRVVR